MSRQRWFAVLVAGVALLALGGALAWGMAYGNRLGSNHDRHVIGTQPFAGAGVTFDYPANWRLIAEAESCGIHGDTILIAVGTGIVSIPRDETHASDGTSTLRCDPFAWSVKPDRIALAYWVVGVCCPLPDPSPALHPGETRVVVGGRAAGYSETTMSRTWRMLDTREVIEARFGADAAPEADSELPSLIESWAWTSNR